MLKRLSLLSLLLLASAPASAQTPVEFGTWQYFKVGGVEAIYTESTDEDRTFSLEIQCEKGKPTVQLTYLLAAAGDDIGLDPDRFAPDGEVVTSLDGERVGAGDWTFSTYSEVFINQDPEEFITALENAHEMVTQAWYSDGTSVGTYPFNLLGTESALAALSCYGDTGR